MLPFDRTPLEIFIYVIIPAGLTWMACLWLFYVYFKTKERTLGFKMICVLGVADFLFSTAVIGEKLTLGSVVFKFFAHLFYGALYFSILWASAMSYVVFKSLNDQETNSQNLFKKILGAVLIATAGAGLIFGYFDGKFDNHRIELFVIPLGICILCTFFYYRKSANFIKSQSDCQLKSTKLYIATLRAYSLAHLTTFTPSLLFLVYYQTHPDLSSETVSKIWGPCEALSLLAGFINALIYLRQRLVGKISHSIQNNNDDLTVDLVKVDNT